MNPEDNQKAAPETSEAVDFSDYKRDYNDYNDYNDYKDDYKGQ